MPCTYRFVGFIVSFPTGQVREIGRADWVHGSVRGWQGEGRAIGLPREPWVWAQEPSLWEKA